MHIEQLKQLLDEAGLQPQLTAGTTATIERVHSDSRSVRPGDLFVALAGEHFDGHAFLARAQDAGAVAALVQRGRAQPALACIEVDDTRVALGALAQQWRRQLPIPLIAVTGSNGKTTVTQMLAAMLHAAYGEHALATQGNLNNDIGLPLTLLRLRPHHRMAVVELGMNHVGEIAHLAALAQPTVALVNNAQREHQEFMQSVQAVAAENGAVIAALGPDGVAVFPADDTYSPLWRELAGAREVVDFGSRQARVHMLRARQEPGGWRIAMELDGESLDLHLRVPGRHNLRNAMAAAAAALAAGVPLQAIGQGLQDFRAVQGRGQVHQLLHDDGTRQVLVDDSYNANPDSVRAAIEVLAGMAAPGLLVLGDMGEVGRNGPAMHAEMGEYAKARGIDGLWTLGRESALASQAFGPGGRHFESMEALLAALLPVAPVLAAILVKGSRFMRMERVVEAVLAQDGSASGRVVAW